MNDEFGGTVGRGRNVLVYMVYTQIVDCTFKRVFATKKSIYGKILTYVVFDRFKYNSALKHGVKAYKKVLNSKES